MRRRRRFIARAAKPKHHPQPKRKPNPRRHPEVREPSPKAQKPSTDDST